MPDRFINWPPPIEALIPLVKALARAAAEEDFRKEQAFLRDGRHLRRSFSPADPVTDGRRQGSQVKKAPPSPHR